MRVAIVTNQVLFVRGGAEIQAAELAKALYLAGHEAEIVAIPFKRYPSEQIFRCIESCRLLDISESCGQPIDRVIALKFPSYFIPHHHKLLWLCHQFRIAYDLWNTEYSDLRNKENGDSIRRRIMSLDSQVLQECSGIFSISRTVSNRLWEFNKVSAFPLYHPPKNVDAFYCEEPDSYLLFPSRITLIKRQELVLKALKKTQNPVRVYFIGKADQQKYSEDLVRLAQDLISVGKVAFWGEVSEQDKIRMYAKSLGIIYLPFNEDYGYVTLEAMLSSKPVITCSDSGGSLEFVVNNETGLIVEPTPDSVAVALDTLWENREFATSMGKQGRKRYWELGIRWSFVLEQLLGA